MAQTVELAAGGHESQQPGPCGAEAAAACECVEEALATTAEQGEENKQAFVEVFVGGLPPDASDEEVQTAFATVGDVSSVRLNRRKKTGECKGFGFVRFADQATAEKACVEVKEACGKAVGVHISRARSAEQAGEEQLSSVLPEECDPDNGINKLLRLIRNHSDKRAAVTSALKAVLAVPSKPKPCNSTDKSGEKGNKGSMEGSGDADGKLTREDASLPDPATFLESYPRCKHLVEIFRANPNTHNKTPLAILHEYATRLSLELMYNENADSNLGPFTVDAKLTSVGGAVLYATGEGRGRGKKDAKQVAAAAVLEMLLANVPESDFLQPGKAKILKVQVNPRSVIGNAARVGFVARGRGRGRWVQGHMGRPLELPVTGGNYPPPANVGLEGQQYNSVFPGTQEAYNGTDMYGLPSLNAVPNGKVRSLAAVASQQDADIIQSLRGNSLDTITSIQRQLAGLPLAQEAPLGLYGNSRSFDNSGFTVGYNPEMEQPVLIRNQQPPASLQSLQADDLGGLGVTNSQLASSNISNYGLQAPLQPFPQY